LSQTVFVLEDDADIARLVQHHLEAAGFAARLYHTPTNVIPDAERQPPALFLLDIMVPGGDGLDVCRRLRSNPALSTVPIIFLTARDSELDAVSGLRLGADDFLTKDVSLPHLAARVAALFRRIDALRQPADAAQILRRGALAIDTQKLQTSWNGTAVVLSLTEFWIVHALARNPGHVKNRQQLMDAANVVLDDDTITSHIKRVRRKFQAIDAAFDAIQTVYGMGYRWVE